MDLPDFFGIDIGNHSIKVAEVKRHSENDAELMTFGSIETPFGLVNSEDQVAKERLSNKIKDVITSSGIKTKKCVAALPEASIFTRLMTVPKVEESQLEELVYWEARQHIPLPLANVQRDFIPIAEKEVNGKKMLQLLLVAAPKTLVNRYMEIIKNAGLELLALETETIATSRAIAFSMDLKDTVMALDFGANGTDMSVMKNGGMIFSQSLNTGSDALTKAIATDFNLEIAQAEQYKIAYGLDPNQAEGKVYRSIEPIIQIVADEVNRTFNFFRTQLPDSIPNKIVLVGDGAKLKNLDNYLSGKVGVAAELINPLQRLKVRPELKDDVERASMVGYTVAVGLGLKTK